MIGERSRRRALESLAEALLPQGGVLDPGAGDVRVTETVGVFSANFNPAMRTRLSLLILMWDLGPLIALRRRFHDLSMEQREYWIGRAVHSRNLALRIPLVILKQMIFMAYASSAEVEDHLGFDYSCRQGHVHGK